MKKTIREGYWAQNNLLYTDQNRIIKKIKEYPIISFDVFDTLLKRNVLQPKIIFDILEREGERKFGCIIRGFAVNRVKAELEARNKSVHEEVTIAEIYDQLQPFYTLKVRQWLLSKENEIEYRLCCINNELENVYRYCVDSGKKIIIASDMYLSSDLIVRMLNKCGIKKWNHIFISSEIMKTKAMGSLYDHILCEIHKDSNNILHIGDNIHSDYLQAKKHGIKSILIRKSFNHLEYEIGNTEDVIGSSIYAFINNTKMKVKQSYQLGYECFGPLLFGFVVWLKEEIKKEGIEDIFFLSRDGYILKKAFDIINQKENGVNSHYFLASRKALRVPLLADNISYSEFIKSNFWGQYVNVKEFCKEMGVAEYDGENEYIINNFDYAVSKNKLANDEVFQKVFAIMVEHIKERARFEKDALLQYIKQEKIGSRKSAIVDIGWHGNMQKNLQHHLERNVKHPQLVGFYIGVIPKDNQHENVRMKGFLFDDGKNFDLYRQEADINSLFEQIFMAPHGSVDNYMIDNDRNVSIKFCENEQKDEESIKVLSDYQKGGLKFIEEFLEYRDLIPINEVISAHGVFNQFLHPRYEETFNWGNIVFKDIDEKKLICTRGLLYYIFHPWAIMNDYRNSIWKEGFLKQTFKLNLDYYKIIKLMQKIKAHNI